MPRAAAAVALLALLARFAEGSLSIPLARRTVRTPLTPGRGVRAYVGIGHDRRVQEEVPVFGDFKDLAYYYADVFVGTPPQKFTVIADTGSALMAMPCADCGDCGFSSHLNPPYSAAASSTAVALPCGDTGCPASCAPPAQCPYSVSYAEGSSLSGVFWRDRVFLGDADAGTAAAHARFTLPAFRFGCHKHEGGLFKTQAADGILGLGTGALSIIPALVASGDLAAPLFSLCLSFVGGAMTLGAIDESLHLAPAQWGPLSAGGYYVVRVEGVSLVPSPAVLGGPPGPDNGWGLSNALTTHLPAGGMNSPHTIVDSGTSFTYVPSDTFNALRAAVQEFCRAAPGRCVGAPASIRHESLCYTLRNPADLETFPGLVIQLQGGVTVDLPPEHLFVNMGWDNGAYCLGVYDNGGGGGVLGGNTMMGHDVIFDLTQGAQRLGWAPSRCVARSPGAVVTASASASVSASSTAAPASPSVAPAAAAESASASAAPPSQPPAPVASASPDPAVASPSDAPRPSDSSSSSSSSSAPATPATATASPLPLNASATGGGGALPPPPQSLPDAPFDPAPAALVAAAVALVLTFIAVCCWARGPCECHCARLTLRFEERGAAKDSSTAAGGARAGSVAAAAAAASLERGSISPSVPVGPPARRAAAAPAGPPRTGAASRGAYAQLSTVPEEQ